MKTWEEIYDYANKHDITAKSAVNEEAWCDFIRSLDLEIVVEMGTYKGLSAAFFATVAKKVITFDIKDWQIKYKLWYDNGLSDKIVFVQNKRMKDIEKALRGVDFDFCFVDGLNTFEQLVESFDIAKRCGRILYHNTQRVPKYAKGTRFLDEIIKGNYQRIGRSSAYWNVNYKGVCHE